jgi:hypothetical protein
MPGPGEGRAAVNRQPDDDEPAEDYGYDLAHDAPDRDRAAGDKGDRNDRSPAERPGVEVATQTDDENGDYGYDLAHDVPRR